MNFSAAEMQRDLQAHTKLSTELLELARRENERLRGAEGFSPELNDYRRQDLLGRLEECLKALRAHRSAWQRLPAAEQARHPELADLIRTAQEMAMKFILLDRENEQLFLRRGLLPARHLPAASRQQPNYVVSLYQRPRQILP